MNGQKGSARVPSPGPLVEEAFFYENTAWRLLSVVIWVAFVFLVTVVFALWAGASIPHFWTALLRQGQLFPLLVLAPPMVLIVASGGLDLSVGALAALVSVVLAAMISRATGVVPAVAVGMLVALAVGLLNGLLAGLVRINGALVTLGMAFLLRGLAGLISEESVIAAVAAADGLESFNFPALKWGIAALSIVGCALLAHLTPIGRRPSPAGENRESWIARGVFVGSPYLVSSLMAGVAGTWYCSWLCAGDPEIATGLELRVVFAVLLGGTFMGGRFGTVIGAVLGVLLAVMIDLAVVSEGLSPAVQTLLIGGGIVVAALLGGLYYGLVGSMFRYWQRRKGKLA